MGGYGDLHIHTRLSGGGTLDVFEILSEIKNYNKRHIRKKIGLVSFPDHETVEASEKAERIGKAFKIDVIPGAAEFRVNDGNQTVDILGYMMDTTNLAFKKWLVTLRNERLVWMDGTIGLVNKELEERGIRKSIREIDVQTSMRSVGEYISEYCIARAMVNKGIVSDQEEALDEYLLKDRPAYSKFKYHKASKVIDMIKDSGGEAVVAHPVFYKGMKGTIKGLKSLGIDGVEAYHTAHDRKLTRNLREFAKKQNLMVYGGSDFHGPFRFDMYSGNIPSAYPEAKIGSVRLPIKYTKAIKKLWHNKRK